MESIKRCKHCSHYLVRRFQNNNENINKDTKSRKKRKIEEGKKDRKYHHITIRTCNLLKLKSSQNNNTLPQFIHFSEY